MGPQDKGRACHPCDPRASTPAPARPTGMAGARIDGRSGTLVPSCDPRGKARRGGWNLGVSAPHRARPGASARGGVRPRRAVPGSAPCAPTPAAGSYLRPGLRCPRRTLRGQLDHSGALPARGRSRLAPRCAPGSSAPRLRAARPQPRHSLGLTRAGGGTRGSEGRGSARRRGGERGRPVGAGPMRRSPPTRGGACRSPRAPTQVPRPCAPLPWVWLPATFPDAFSQHPRQQAPHFPSIPLLSFSSPSLFLSFTPSNSPLSISLFIPLSVLSPLPL